MHSVSRWLALGPLGLLEGFVRRTRSSEDRSPQSSITHGAMMGLFSKGSISRRPTHAISTCEIRLGLELGLG